MIWVLPVLFGHSSSPASNCPLDFFTTRRAHAIGYITVAPGIHRPCQRFLKRLQRQYQSALRISGGIKFSSYSRIGPESLVGHDAPIAIHIHYTPLLHQQGHPRLLVPIIPSFRFPGRAAGSQRRPVLSLGTDKIGSYIYIHTERGVIKKLGTEKQVSHKGRIYTHKRQLSTQPPPPCQGPSKKRGGEREIRERTNKPDHFRGLT